MKLTEAQFAAQACYISKNAAAWAGDICNPPDNLMGEAKDETVARFIVEMRARLDRLWLWGLEFAPVPPTAGDGDSFASSRNSSIWPGFYAGRCACGAHFTAEKRAPRCDPCEMSRRAAVATRMSALAETDGGGE